MSKITKAIIPAAGLGTRFLPATKSIPKEMFPIIDTPTLQHIAQEAKESGITDLGIIVSAEKPCITHHFSIDELLEKRLKSVGKFEEAQMVRDIANMINVTFIFQNKPKGLGHAIHCAKDFINGEDFAIMLGDDLVINQNGKPVLAQLLDVYEEKHASVLGVQKVPENDVNKYGIVNPAKIGGRLVLAKSVIEKPDQKDAPSNFAVLGRYVLTNRIFDILERIKPGKGGEIQLTDAIDVLMQEEEIYAYDFEGKRYDIGDKFGYVKATIDFALNREDLKDKVLEYIKNIK